MFSAAAAANLAAGSAGQAGQDWAADQGVSDWAADAPVAGGNAANTEAPAASGWD